MLEPNRAMHDCDPTIRKKIDVTVIIFPIFSVKEPTTFGIWSASPSLDYIIGFDMNLCYTGIVMFGKPAQTDRNFGLHLLKKGLVSSLGLTFCFFSLLFCP